MNYIVIDPKDYPLLQEENWFIVDPNNIECKFEIPEGSFCCCTKEFRGFSEGTLYLISQHSMGWITVVSPREVVKMPEYLYARHFDAETYVKNKNTTEYCSFPSNTILIED